MKYKFKPIMLGSAVAVIAALSGCGSDPEQPKIVDVFAEEGLWCKSPTIVQIASPDSYPLSAEEDAALATAKAEAKAAAEAEAGDAWDEAAWEADFKYEDLDLYAVLGLTEEELVRQAEAKEEALAFQIAQGQDVIRGEGFETWFNAWFANIPPASYLGPSQRINRSANETTPEMNGDEICYTPPLSCPNYKVIDESGTYDCIVPEQNPLEAPAASVVAGANEAIAFYRHEDHVDNGDNTELYANMVAHTFNDAACTSYEEDSISSWGLDSPYGLANSGIDPYYGKYWKIHLLDKPANCGNIIFNDTATGKKISDSDLIMPIGPSGNVTLHNLDKSAFADDNFPLNVLDGMLLINQHPFFGAEASSGVTSCGWSQEANDEGICVGEALVCPEDTVAVGVGAEEIASKCVAVFDPEVTDLLIRGGFNGWDGAGDVNSTFMYADNQYRLNHTHTTEETCVIIDPIEEDLDAEPPVVGVPGEDCTDSYDFKVADAAWSEPTTFGTIKGDQSAVGSTVSMTVGEGVGQNMKVDMTKDKVYQYLVNATDPAAVTLTINEVPVDAFPVITIGTDSSDLVYKTKGQYVFEQALVAGTTYTVSVSEFGADLGAPVDNTLLGDTAVTLVADGTAFNFTALREGKHNFILDLSNTDATTFKVETPKPYGADAIFIRGTVTGWGDPAPDEDELLWNVDDRTYSVIYGLEKDGSHAFKFASQAWGGPLDEAAGKFTFSDDGETLTGSGGDNIGVVPSMSTTYQFSISYATASPVLKVEEAPLYVRGGLTDGSWGAVPAGKLGFTPTDAANPVEASHIYTVEIVWAGGNTAFKIADNDWGGSLGYNYGANADDVNIVLGEPLTLYSDNSDPDIGGSKNINLAGDAGTYIFAFEDGVTKTLTVTLKE